MSTRIDSSPTGASDACLPGDALSSPTTESAAKPDGTRSKPPETMRSSGESHQVESYAANASYDDGSHSQCGPEGAPTISAAMLMMSRAPSSKEASDQQSIDPSASGSAAHPGSTPTSAAQSMGAKKPSEPEKKKEAPKTAGPAISEKAIATETVPEKAPAGFKAVALNVPWYSQFENHGSVKGNGTQCNAMTREMMKDGKNTANPGGRDPTWNFNVAESKDDFGRIQPNAARAKEGRGYIDAQLDAGHPVMVGVMWRTPTPGANDGNADHYVAITGRGVAADGTAYYTFNDPGATSAANGADTREKNRFFVDANTGMLFRPGLQEAPWKMYTVDARYEVSQVRKNQ